jgi:hypothetical protein
MKRNHRLRLEVLETRQLLATCNVVRLGDFGAGATMGDFSRGDLRFCINHANANPGADVININATGTINLTGPLPELATDMEILGPGANVATVRRNTGGNYRIFAVAPGATVRIAGLHMMNGLVVNDVGGGIRNRGTLTVDDCRVTGNKATNSGDYSALKGGGIYNEGTLTINHSVVSSNTSSNVYSIGFDPLAYGGGIYNTGALSISDSALNGNLAIASGKVYGDTAGGGIFNSGSLLTLTRSTLANNEASGGGNDGGSGLGGGIYSSQGAFTIADCTISGNKAAGYGGSDISVGGGGGVALYGGTLTMKNRTLTGNWIVADVFYPTADGIEVRGTATITHSTIAGNGMDVVIYAASLTLRNSIVGDNASYASLSGVIANSGYNIIARADWGSGYVPSDILNVNPMLGPLADNGGPTQTRALLPGSPAIDSGTNQGSPEWDQRGPGFPRIVNGTIDRGAFEVQATGALTHDDFLAILITADLESKHSHWRS